MSAICAIYPQESAAEGFTGSEFTEWSEAGQNNYIETSVTMAGMVFSQTHPSVATCINYWYFASASGDSEVKMIRDTVEQYNTAHPSGVILAVILRECPLDS
ncbi:hypothetical protein EBB79_15045 [Parasedimentitalea marina]|uniref:Rap1a immunity protein domain-containing protein n=1 Tax=Parasedimentitalea marina TaxID=2483033 RepID=A0A3T0N4X7_9RHOB|nr:hypothetical protein [Parasedimentitalea marina]AZV79057.1 hypothetical protein EBB79_15045 [Parasedimentitalea marina]